MPSLVLRTTTRLLLPLLLVFSVFLLLRGHNAPGGGFVGGLGAATAFVLYALASGVDAARQALGVDPKRLAAAGLLVALASGCVALVAARPFMTGLWLAGAWPVVGKIGTPVVFDGGVYLLVAGITLTIVFALMEE
jgi:multicomponent Na+:H+ antiporter subunit B